jgi:hypothetical protein
MKKLSPAQENGVLYYGLSNFKEIMARGIKVPDPRVRHALFQKGLLRQVPKEEFLARMTEEARAKWLADEMALRTYYYGREELSEAGRALFPSLNEKALAADEQRKAERAAKLAAFLATKAGA